ncbi:MAG TPA: DUF2071 domain-containing protein [Blastocatellia bacterium]|nr:DUF2071 domain-containing protein [Blastocatellia bacterium]
MSSIQVQLALKNLLFINYSVPPDRLRPLVPDELELDTSTDKAGREVAFVSAVAFHVAELRSSLLPIVRPSFDQVNYRTYVNAGEGPAVYFFHMNVNSRMISAATIMLGMPVSHEEIEIVTEPASVTPDTMIREVRCRVSDEGRAGLEADIEVVGRQASVGPQDEAVPPHFIVERPIGYVKSAADGIMKITVEHPPLDAITARANRVRAPELEALGVLNMDESGRPHSVLYVKEAVFRTYPPMLWLPKD